MEQIVRWGVLGAAQFALKRWIPSMLETPGAQAVAMASRNLEKSREAADRFGFPKAFGSYEALLADPDIDAVYIPLPNGLHAEWCIRALEAGKHVMVEKPAASHPEEAHRMRMAARVSGCRLMEAFMIRHHARWKRLRERVQAGDIGTPRLVDGAFCFTLDDPSNARWDPQLAGGALSDVGCYLVNASRFVLNAEPLSAWGAASDTRGTGVDSTFVGSLQFSEARLVFTCSFETAFRQAFTVVGTEGSMTINRPFICRDEPVTITVFDRSGQPTSETVPLGDQYVDMISHFQACVHDPELPLAPGEDGLESAIALAMLRDAAASHQSE